MRLPRVWLVSLTLAFVSAAATTAHAAPSEHDPARPTLDASAIAARDFRATLGLGGFAGAGTGGGSITGNFRYRNELWLAGGKAELNLSLFIALGAAVVGGWSIRTGDVRLDLLGEFGAHQYVGVGYELFGDPGASGAAPYAGGRAIVSFPFSNKPRHTELGLYIDFQDDLTRRRVTYTYTYKDLFDSSEREERASHVVGMARIGFGIEIATCRDF